MEPLSGFGRSDVADGFDQPAMVEAVHPFASRERGSVPAVQIDGATGMLALRDASS